MVGLCSHPIGGSAWGVSALEPGLNAKLVTSGSAHSNEYSLGPLAPVSFSHSETQPLSTSPGLLKGRPGPCFYGVTALPWVPVHVKPLGHPPVVESLSHPVLWSAYTQAHWPSKPNVLEAPPPNATSPGWGARLGAQNSHSWENLCNIIIFQYVGSRYGIWSYHEKTPPWWLIW